ncbi:hypothetical protein QE435_005055 [Rhizobium sp. SORGH_AS 787]|nr:hypothetical protein [Rhizobium sp. SORGH_AS_0787]
MPPDFGRLFFFPMGSVSATPPLQKFNPSNDASQRGDLSVDVEALLHEVFWIGLSGGYGGDGTPPSVGSDYRKTSQRGLSGGFS